MPGQIGGNRPGQGGNWPGLGNRPGQGGNNLGNRPGQGGNNLGNRPGQGGNNLGNRPGQIGGGNIGSGNIGSGNNVGQIGNNLGVVNRPNYGGNNFGGNYYGGNTTNVINNNRGGWGGGNWDGGYFGGGRPIVNNNFYGVWGGGYHGGWARPYYGNWYRGGWGGSSFWAGYGLGAMTTFGLGTLGRVLTPNYGYAYGVTLGYPAIASYGVYDYFPTWSAGTYAGWGLGPVASTMVYSGYTNPYYATVVAAQPAQTAVAYDYSQPINVTATPPEPSVAESTEQIFAAARDSFKAGDYPRALELADQVLKKTPNVPVVHEFRALTLFALKRYDEAASVVYAVLSSGPGWNWPTLAGLYADVDTYTNQIRALEAYAKSAPASASAQLLLAYHYMVQGHADAAAAEFEKVSKLQPGDRLAASFVKAFKKATESAAAPAQAVATAQLQPQPSGPPAAAPAPAAAPESAAPAPAESDETPPPPPVPPASMLGTWKAQPAPDLSISLTLKEDGAFTWLVDSRGTKQTLEGQAGFNDGTLALLQAEGPPLVGKVTPKGANGFEFRPSGAVDNAPPLSFKK